MSIQPILLGYRDGSWTGGEIRVKVRSYSEPDRAVPVNARISAVPDVLSFAMGQDEQEVTARVTVKSEASLPADDRVQVTVQGDPASDAALAATQLAGMLPPGVSLPRFPSMTAVVEVILVPYEVVLTALMPDGSERSGNEFPLDMDGSSVVKVRAQVYRVSGAGLRQQDPLALSGELVGQPTLPGLALAAGSEGQSFTLSATSTEVEAGGAGSSCKVSFKLNLPNGKSLIQHVTFALRPLQAELTCDAREVGVGASHALEGPRFTLRLHTAEGRPVKTAYRLQATLGNLSPAAGQLDDSGTAVARYDPPAPSTVADSPDSWPRVVTVKALVGPKGQEAASCDLTLTFRRSLKVVVEKIGFARWEKELELTGPGPLTLKVVTRARTQSVAVAHASVQGSKKTDKDGLCAVEEGTGAALPPVEVVLDLAGDIASLQKRVVEGLREGAGGAAPEDYRSAQSSLEELVEKGLPERLAEEDEESYEGTYRVMLALAGSVKVMLMARGCFERRFERVKVSLKAALDATLSAVWELWGGPLFTALLTKVATLLSSAAMAVGRLVGGRLMGWSVAGVIRTVGGLKVTFEKAYTRLADKVSGLFNQSRVPATLQQRLTSNPATGPVPMSPGTLATALKAELEKALDVLKAKLSSLKDAVRVLQTELAAHQAEVRELEQTIMRHRGVPGTSLGDLEARLAALQARGGPIGERLTRATSELEKAELEVLDKEARNQTMGALAEKLDTLVNLCAGLLNVIYNLLGALLLGLIACMLRILQRCVLRAGYSSVILERLGQILEDMVGNLLCEPLSREGVARGTAPTEKIHRQLAALQLKMAGPALTTTYQKLKDWPEIDRQCFEAAVRGYYEGVERSEFLTEEREVWHDFAADMLDWLEWLVLWFSRVGMLLAGLVALFASAGTATPAVWAFEAEANLAIESMNKWYKGLKAVASGLESMGTLALTVGVVLPGFVEYTVRLFDDQGLRDRAAVPLSLDSRLLDPELRP